MIIEFGNVWDLSSLMTELLIEFDIIFWIIELGAYFCSYRVCFPYAYRVWIMVLIELGNFYLSSLVKLKAYRVWSLFCYRVWTILFIEFGQLKCSSSLKFFFLIEFGSKLVSEFEIFSSLGCLSSLKLLLNIFSS